MTLTKTLESTVTSTASWVGRELRDYWPKTDYHVVGFGTSWATWGGVHLYDHLAHHYGLQALEVGHVTLAVLGVGTVLIQQYLWGFPLAYSMAKEGKDLKARATLAWYSVEGLLAAYSPQIVSSLM